MVVRVNHSLLRLAAPARCIEDANDRVLAQAFLDQQFLPAVDLSRRDGDDLCGRPVVFDQGEDRIYARSGYGGQGQRFARRG